MATIEKVTPATTTRATKEVYTDLGPVRRKVQRYIERPEGWVLVEEFEQVWQFPYGWIAKWIG